jgi:hypothetical protein
MNCNRCGKETSVHIMSMFNTEEICMDCKAAEEMRADYKGCGRDRQCGRPQG